MDNSQQTLLWQQNQYLADSGIHSASDTQAPSISSKMGIDGSGMSELTPTNVQQPTSMMYDFDEFSVPPVYGQPQVNGLSHVHSPFHLYFHYNI